MNLEDKLDRLQHDESVGGAGMASTGVAATTSSGNAFGMDSFPETKNKKKKSILRTVYPEMLLLFQEKRAMIDLDQTIHKYSRGWQGGDIYDVPFDGAKDAINWLKDNGYEIVIFTTRASPGNAAEQGGDENKEIAKVQAWLKHHNIYFDRITADKLSADFYIDDKAIPIHNGNWDAVLKVIKKRMKFIS
jgi:hypothetical protein